MSVFPKQLFKALPDLILENVYQIKTAFIVWIYHQSFLKVCSSYLRFRSSYRNYRKSLGISERERFTGILLDTCFQKSFRKLGSKIWNNLPPHIENTENPLFLNDW